MGKAARVGQLKEIINKERADIVGIQETIKKDFSDIELRGLSSGIPFLWNWIPAQGRSGGMGKDDILEIEGWNKGSYYIEVSIQDRINNFRWRLAVYGPANHKWSADFIQELAECCQSSRLPIALHGDFNLIRSMEDKSNNQGDLRLIKLFNEFIKDQQLREIMRSGPRFTWTNKQEEPIMSNLDRVLDSIDWEQQFRFLQTLTRLGSDHCPLILDDVASMKRQMRIFRFEKQWNKREGFKDLIEDKWGVGSQKVPATAYSVRKWHTITSSLRQFLKGWGGNIKGENKRLKEDILYQIREITE